MGRGSETLQLRLHRDCGFHSLGHRHQPRAGEFGCGGRVARREAHNDRRRIGAHRNRVGEAARLRRAGVPGDRLPVRGARVAGAAVAGGMSMKALPIDLQILNMLAALLLLLSFAMLSQRRIVTLVNLLALQGALLGIATLLLAWRTGANHLYLSAALTLGLKVIFLPWLLHRLIRRLGVYWGWRSRFRRSPARLRAIRSASPSP